MDLKEFFKPTKRKIIFSLIIPIVWVVFLLILRIIVLKLKGVIILPAVENNINYLAIFNLALFKVLILGLIVQMIYHYPLACFISKLVDIHKKKKKVFSLKNIIILILLILIFNPITLKIIFNFNYIFYDTGSITLIV